MKRGFYRSARFSQAACFVVFAFVCFFSIAGVEIKRKFLLAVGKENKFIRKEMTGDGRSCKTEGK